MLKHVFTDPGSAKDVPLKEAQASANRSRALFTMLGIVLALLLVAVALLVIIKARPAAAAASIKNLDGAVQSYKLEYTGRPWPLALPWSGPTAPTQDAAPISTLSPEGSEILQTLLGGHPTKNPRRIIFMQTPKSGWLSGSYSPGAGLTDPWRKEGYRMLFDYDGDGLIANPEGGSAVKRPVLIYSAGPDQDFTTWDDNVCSWK